MNSMQVALCVSLSVADMACTGDGEGETPAERTSATDATVNTVTIASEIRRLSEAHAKSAMDKDTARVGTIFAEDARYLPK